MNTQLKLIVTQYNKVNRIQVQTKCVQKRMKNYTVILEGKATGQICPPDEHTSSCAEFLKGENNRETGQTIFVAMQAKNDEHLD